MLEYIAIPAAALLASFLAFFAGFGLGTVLLPVFALFFPIVTAVALTAFVHLLNSLFRFLLVARHTNKDVVLRFGLITVIASLAGALLLSNLADLKPLFTYTISDAGFEITIIKIIVSAIILFFSLWEVLPPLRGASFERKYLPLGGFLSGFFGGLSGHQGPLRSAFLERSGLGKESFIATNALIGIMVDIPRMAVYISSFPDLTAGNNLVILSLATAAGLLGALAGSLWLKKITMRMIRIAISVMLAAIAIALGGGLI